MCDGPFEPGDVGGAETEFSFPLNQKQAIVEFFLQFLNDAGSAVGRIVVDDENVEILFEVKHISDNIFDIFLFVVCRNKNNAV